MKLPEDEPLVSSASMTPPSQAEKDSDHRGSNKKMKHFHSQNDENHTIVRHSHESSLVSTKQPVDVPSVPWAADNAFDITVDPIDESDSSGSVEFEKCNVEEEGPRLCRVTADEAITSSHTRVQVVTAPSSPSNSSTKRVSFSVVQIQEYSLTLGDHPCSDAYPISLDWPHTPMHEVDLMEYESSRDAERRSSHQSSSPAPSLSCQHLSPRQRRVRLSLVSGMNPKELKRQEQRRNQQAILEQAQQYMTDFGDEEYAYGDEMHPDANTFTDNPSADDADEYHWDDQVYSDVDFEPIQVTRSKSLSESEFLDASILDYLSDCDLDKGNNNEDNAFVDRRQMHRNQNRR